MSPFPSLLRFQLLTFQIVKGGIKINFKVLFLLSSVLTFGRKYLVTRIDKSFKSRKKYFLCIGLLTNNNYRLDKSKVSEGVRTTVHKLTSNRICKGRPRHSISANQ